MDKINFISSCCFDKLIIVISLIFSTLSGLPIIYPKSKNMILEIIINTMSKLQLEITFKLSKQQLEIKFILSRQQPALTISLSINITSIYNIASVGIYFKSYHTVSKRKKHLSEEEKILQITLFKRKEKILHILHTYVY